MLGAIVGREEGNSVGRTVGMKVGSADGDFDGVVVGIIVGKLVGFKVVGTDVGAADGAQVPQSAGHDAFKPNLQVASRERQNEGSVWPLHWRHVPHVPGQLIRK